jgi:hypothetical protein
MWEQSSMTSAGQLEALRLLSAWLDTPRRRRPGGRFRRAGGAGGGTMGEVLVLPPGSTPARLDEQLEEAS